MDRYKVVERIETPPIAALNLKKYLAHDLKSQKTNSEEPQVSPLQSTTYTFRGKKSDMLSEAFLLQKVLVQRFIYGTKSPEEQELES